MNLSTFFELHTLCPQVNLLVLTQILTTAPPPRPLPLTLRRPLRQIRQDGQEIKQEKTRRQDLLHCLAAVSCLNPNNPPPRLNSWLCVLSCPTYQVSLSQLFIAPVLCCVGLGLVHLSLGYSLSLGFCLHVSLAVAAKARMAANDFMVENVQKFGLCRRIIRDKTDRQGARAVCAVG